MKLNFKVFKKGKPIYWIVGAIALFVVFYLIVNKGGGGSSEGGVNVYSGGPSDAQVAMSGQIAMAQIQANAATGQTMAEVAAIDKAAQRDIAIATIGGNVELANIAAGREISLLGIQQSYATEMANIDAQKQIYGLQAEYALEGAKVASEYAFKQQAVNAAVVMHQLDTNAAMFSRQAESLEKQSLYNTVSTLKKKDRDNVLIALETGNLTKYADGGGGGNSLGMFAPVTGLLGKFF